MTVNGFEVTRVFYDNTNYPRGFGKSGDFTIAESELLHQYGQAMLALSKGEIQPGNDDEQHFVDVCNGAKPAETQLERTWLKYQNRTGNRVVINAFGSAIATDDTLDADDMDGDIDIDETD